MLFLLFTTTQSFAAVKSSWYEDGELTANGEHYNPNKLTAAHRNLKFGTKVKVTNVKNGKSVIVRINDRGPAKWTGKTIDLSRAAFSKIANLSNGVATVEIEIL